MEIKAPQKRLKINNKIIDSIEYFSCNICGIFKSRENYYKELRSGCKTCHSVLEKRRLSTPRGHMQLMISNSKSHVKRINNNEKRKKELLHDLSLLCLINMWHRQEGRCTYSNIPMSFGSCLDNNWTCSLERRNPDIGYVPDNVCFICAEFNTSIRLTTSLEVQGNSGWCIEK